MDDVVGVFNARMIQDSECLLSKNGPIDRVLLPLQFHL